MDLNINDILDKLDVGVAVTNNDNTRKAKLIFIAHLLNETEGIKCSSKVIDELMGNTVASPNNIFEALGSLGLSVSQYNINRILNIVMLQGLDILPVIIAMRNSMH